MNLMLHGGRREQVMKYSRDLMRHGRNRRIGNEQFQSLGKYEALYVFVTQNVFGNNSRTKWLIGFLQKHDDINTLLSLL